jgi:homogentisate 1,2-dioxygenase
VKRGIPLPRVEGIASRQAHAELPEGTYEREIGREGFFGAATHMYHRHPPTGWSAFEGPLRPRAWDTAALPETAEGPWGAAPLLSNAHLRYRVWHARSGMDFLARNADGDELLFVHRGRGELFCDWGHLSIAEGDYVVLPRGAMWRVELAEPLRALLIEATGSSYQLPDRGLLGEHALFDPAVLETPALDAAFDAQRSETPWQVRVKARGQLSTIRYPFNPLDAVGWKGILAPVRLSWRDIRPVVSARYHLPPSVHTTFVAERFVICTFCPRPLETDPGALKLPFYHSNDDYDEVIFYHGGEFISRDDVRPGMVTHHPFGFSHGPHPRAWARARDNPARETREVAVMLDARDPLEIAEGARELERLDYADSWKDGGAR